MTDVVVLLATQVSTPIKLAWLLWLAWSIVQIGWYRRVRVAASLASRPASRPPIKEASVVQMPETAPADPVMASPSATLDTPPAPPLAASLAGPPVPHTVSGPPAPMKRRRRPPRSVSTSKAALESLSAV